MTFLALSDPNLPRVLVVADDPLTRAGLAALLAERTEVNVVGQTASAELSAQLPVYEPTVIAWDVGSGTGVFDRMTALEDAPPIVALLTEEALAAQAWLSG